MARSEYERELSKVCQKYNIGVIPYSPLAAGFLTGKYERNKPVESKRAGNIDSSYANDRGWRILEEVKKVAEQLQKTPAAVALAWLLVQPAITAPIIGANKPEQLKENLEAADLQLSQEQIEQLNKVSDWKNAP